MIHALRHKFSNSFSTTFLLSSSQATEGDALAAILLFEENVTLQSGFSLFDVLPLPHLIAPELDDADFNNAHHFDVDSWLGTGNDMIMAHLMENLKSHQADVSPILFGGEF